MAHIQINWLSDIADCDQAGCGGGYSEGAEVYIDGELVLNLQPVAACFDGDHWERDQVWCLVLNQLGHVVTA